MCAMTSSVVNGYSCPKYSLSSINIIPSLRILVASDEFLQHFFSFETTFYGDPLLLKILHIGQKKVRIIETLQTALNNNVMSAAQLLVNNLVAPRIMNKYFY